MKTPGETTEVQPRPHAGDGLDLAIICRIALIFVGGIALSMLAIALLFHLFTRLHPERTSEAAPLVTVSDLPPEPRLQAHPELELEQVHAVEDQHLNRYAWIDRTQGTAQIPIDRAITLWVAKYGGAAATNTAPAPGVTELQMRQDKAKEAAHAP